MDDSSSSDILNRLRNLPPRSTAAAPQSRYAAAYAESMGRSTNLPYSYGSSVPSASAASKRESLGMYRTTSSEYGVGAATPLSTSPLSSSALPTSSPLSSSALLSSSPLSTSPAARLGRRSYSRHEPAGPTDVLATTPPKYLTSTTLTSSARPGMRLSSSGRLGANEDDSAAGTSTTTPSRTPPSASRSVDFRSPAKTGLANLGNTCFMNSILQCLCATPELLELCYSGSLASQQRRGKLSTELQSLFLKMHESRASKHVSPSAFLSKMQSHDKRFGGRRQHDSQEFFISLLDGVSKETNTVVTKPKYKELSSKGTAEEQSEEAWSYAKSFEDGPVLDVFQGQLQATTKCKKCGHESHCFDPFLDISLPLGSSRGKDVASCFSKFTEIESLSESEGYKCEKCKSGNVSRRILLRRYPPILVVHLKRFSGGSSVSFLSRSPSFSSYSKDSTTIDLRPNDVLDLRDFCVTDGGARCTTSDSVPPRYRLYGMSNHFGSMGGGHYTADCRSFVKAAGATCDGCTKKQLVAKATELMSSGTLKSSKPSEGTCPAGDDSCKAEGGGQRQPGAPPKPGFADFTFASYILALNAQSLLETGEWRRAVGVSDKVDPKTEKPQRPPRATIDKYYSEVGALYGGARRRGSHRVPHADHLWRAFGAPRRRARTQRRPSYDVSLLVPRS